MKKFQFWAIALLALVAPALAEADRPVDIAGSAGLKVGAAHSMFRAMSRNYAGPLFMVKRTSDSTYSLIYPNGRGGPVNMSQLTSFCGARNTNGCSIIAICDQMHSTCNLSGGLPVNFSTVSVSVASPTVITWANGSTVTPANNTPFYFDYNGSSRGTDDNSKMPAGLKIVDNSPCGSNVCHTQWYCTFNVGTGGNGGNQFNVYAATVTSGVPSCPGGSPTLVNVTGAGTGGAANLAALLYNSGNDLVTTASNGNAGANVGPALSYVTFPGGEVIPIWSSQATQVGRARSGSNLVGTVPNDTQNRTVYGLFTSMTLGANAGTYGIMEDIIYNKSKTNMFSLGVSYTTSTGILCNSFVLAGLPCLFADLENGVFATTTSVTSTISVASPSVVTVSGLPHATGATPFYDGQPIYLSSNLDTLPTGLSFNTIYYIKSPGTVSGGGVTFNLAATPGGTAINTTGSSSGTHLLVLGTPSAIPGGFVYGILTCDQSTASGPWSGLTFDQRTELSPFLTTIGYGAPAGGWQCAASDPTKSGGLSLGEGGDGSSAPIQFLEGFVAVGNMGEPYRQQLGSAIYQRMYDNRGAGTPVYYSFTGGSLPSDFSFSRANCSPQVTGGCATDAEYTDAPGTSFNQYPDGNQTGNCGGQGCPLILKTSKGLGVFTQRSNYLANSGSPANQTTPSLSTSITYVLFCGGASGSSVSFTDNTAVTIPASGTINCTSYNGTPGTGYLDIVVTTAGTLNITVSSSPAPTWFDLQGNSGTSTFTGTFNTSNPNIQLSGVSQMRAGDAVYLTGTTAPGGFGFNTMYWIVNPTAPTFQGNLGGANTPIQLAATPGGTAIQATSTGTSVSVKWIPPGATPHIVTAASVPVTRQQDKPVWTTTTNPPASYLDGSVSAVAIEFNPTTWSAINQTNQYGFLIGAATNNDEAIWWGNSQVLVGPNSRNEGSYSNILPTLGAKNIIAADLGQSIWAMAVNGYVSHTDPTGAGWATTRGASGSVRNIGFDQNSGSYCNCWISRAAIYPRYLTRAELGVKSTSGAALP